MARRCPAESIPMLDGEKGPTFEGYAGEPSRMRNLTLVKVSKTASSWLDKHNGYKLGLILVGLWGRQLALLSG